MKADVNKVKNLSIHVIIIIIITGLCCIHIRALDYIFIINDEFGYWAHAISAAGYDWKDLISQTPYYAWGYSIWLIPIIALLPSPGLWYKAAIGLNVLFLIFSYFLCYQSGRRLFRNADDKLMALVSFLVIIYPSNIVYAQAAWTESLSYMLVWLETYLIVRLDENFSNKYFVGALWVLIYAYAVHNRNIGAVAAGIIALSLVLIKHKKKFWYFPVLFLIMLVGYQGIDMVKNYQIQALWSNSKASGMNNVSLNAATITQYSSRIFEHTGHFLISLFGKYIYLLIGTELTLPIVIYKVFKDSISNIKDRDWWQDYYISKIWILLVAAFMYGICAIQMSYWPARQDYVVYARYMENGFGPILFLAIIYCIMYIRETRAGLLISGGSILIGILPVYYWVTHASGIFNTICSPVIGAFYQAMNSMPKAFGLLVIVLTIVFVVLFGITFCRDKKIKISVVLVGFALVYCVTGHYGGRYALGIRDMIDQKTVPLVEKISDDLKDYDIYYVRNDALDSTCMHPKYFQFLIPDRTIHVVLGEELEQLPDENVIIMVEPEDEEAVGYCERNMGAELIDETWLLRVYSMEGCEE